MDMLFLVGLCIVTVAIIERQHTSMRRIKRVRVEKHERANR